jgi:hypothetical protein
VHLRRLGMCFRCRLVRRRLRRRPWPVHHQPRLMHRRPRARLVQRDQPWLLRSLPRPVQRGRLVCLLYHGFRLVHHPHRDKCCFLTKVVLFFNIRILMHITAF